MVFTDQEKSNFVLMYAEELYDYHRFKTRYRREEKNGRAKIPQKKISKIGSKTFVPRTLDELRMAIEQTAEELRQNREMRERVLNDYVRRLRICLEREGAQVEIR